MELAKKEIGEAAEKLAELLPGLEYGLSVHIEWRDADEIWFQRNPHIGDRDFHAEWVEEYQKRIKITKNAIRVLEKSAELFKK